MSIGNSTESLSQAMLVGTMLVGGLGVHRGVMGTFARARAVWRRPSARNDGRRDPHKSGGGIEPLTTEDDDERKVLSRSAGSELALRRRRRRRRRRALLLRPEVYIYIYIYVYICIYVIIL